MNFSRTNAIPFYNLFVNKNDNVLHGLAYTENKNKLLMMNIIYSNG